MNLPFRRPVDSSQDEALDWLVRLPDADATTRAQFDTWLQASPDNAQAFARAQRAWESPLLASAAANLEQRKQQSPARQRHVRWHHCAAAACLLLTLGTALQSDLPLRLRAEHVTAAGEQRDLRLTDGSRVLLNTGSALSSQIDDDQRRTRLHQGEAYFDVAHDPDRPFEVEAGPVRVSVRSTAFAVRYLQDEAEISVQRGEVDLSTQRGDTRVRLTAGNSIRVGPDGFGERQSAAQPLAWTEGRLVFENCPLSQVLAELQRYYPGWIFNTSEQPDQPEQLRVTANYRIDDPIGAMRSLAQIASLQLHEYPRLLILN